MKSVRSAPARATVPVCPGPGGRLALSAEMDIEEVLAAALHGDEAAFSVLYRTVQPKLLRYLTVLVGRAEAEDVAAEAWVHISRKLHTFRGDFDGFRGWTATIGRYIALDHLRAAGRRPVTDLPEGLLAARADPAGSAERVAMDSVSTEQAVALIARLPPEQAEAVLLRVVLGLDVEATARVLGKRSGAVRVASHRGLRRLAELLREPSPDRGQRPVGPSVTPASR